MSRFTVTDLSSAGLKLIARQRLGDSRGFLSRLFCAEELAAAGWHKPIAQINHTYTAQRRYRARHALPAPAPCRDETGELPARRSVGCRRRPAGRLAHLSALACRDSFGRQPPGAAHSRRLCPWFSGAQRRRGTFVLPFRSIQPRGRSGT